MTSGQVYCRSPCTNTKIEGWRIYCSTLQTDATSCPSGRTRVGRTGQQDQPGTENAQLITPLHAARARVERERHSPPLSPFHAEIARGELAVSILVFLTSHPLGAPPLDSQMVRERVSPRRRVLAPISYRRLARHGEDDKAEAGEILRALVDGGSDALSDYEGFDSAKMARTPRTAL